MAPRAFRKAKWSVESRLALCAELSLPESGLPVGVTPACCVLALALSMCIACRAIDSATAHVAESTDPPVLTLITRLPFPETQEGCIVAGARAIFLADTMERAWFHTSARTLGAARRPEISTCAVFTCCYALGTESAYAVSAACVVLEVPRAREGTRHTRVVRIADTGRTQSTFAVATANIRDPARTFFPAINPGVTSLTST